MPTTAISDETSRRLSSTVINVQRLSCIIANVCNDKEPAIPTKLGIKIKGGFMTVMVISIRLHPDCMKSV